MGHSVNIVIQSLQDAIDGKAIVEGITRENCVPSEFKVGILEGGMQSGKTSVMIVMTDSQGKHIVGQCSAEMFDTINQAVKGAVERFGK